MQQQTNAQAPYARPKVNNLVSIPIKPHSNARGRAPIYQRRLVAWARFQSDILHAVIVRSLLFSFNCCECDAALPCESRICARSLRAAPYLLQPIRCATRGARRRSAARVCARRVAVFLLQLKKLSTRRIHRREISLGVELRDGPFRW